MNALGSKSFEFGGEGMRIIVLILLLLLFGCTEKEVAVFLVDTSAGGEFGIDEYDCPRIKNSCASNNLNDPDSYVYSEFRNVDGTKSCGCVKK